MKTSKDEALKSLDDIFNYCEEIDNNIPENERSGYKMLPDIQKIREYIIENTRPNGEWIDEDYGIGKCWATCSECGESTNGEAQDHGFGYDYSFPNFCPNCGADMRKEGEEK